MSAIAFLSKVLSAQERQLRVRRAVDQPRPQGGAGTTAALVRIETDLERRGPSDTDRQQQEHDKTAFYQSASIVTGRFHGKRDSAL